jgi:heme/copper-type cytochrome/quinol oxidase subunit 4
MNESKTAEPRNSQFAGQSASHEHPVDFKSYLRRCACVFAAALCMIFLMVFTSFSPIHSWLVKSAIIIAIACVNAFVVAGYLMHLLSEKKTIYTLLAFTAFFFAGLMGLTIYAMQDMPHGTIYH